MGCSPVPSCQTPGAGACQTGWLDLHRIRPLARPSIRDLVLPGACQTCTYPELGSFCIRKAEYIQLNQLIDKDLRIISIGRVGLGGRPPKPPTDPDVQNSSIRFLTPRLRCMAQQRWTTRAGGRP